MNDPFFQDHLSIVQDLERDPSQALMSRLYQMGIQDYTRHEKLGKTEGIAANQHILHLFGSSEVCKHLA